MHRQGLMPEERRTRRRQEWHLPPKWHQMLAQSVHFGFRIGEVRPGAVDRARLSVKPSIAGLGAYGIPLRDEFELVLDLRLTG